MKGKGTDFKALMWAYNEERTARKLKYIRNCKDYNRKLYRPYRCERVMFRLLRLDFKRVFGRELTTNEMD